MPLKTVIYVDVLLLVNFIIGYFLLRATGIMCAMPLPFARNIFGAVLAAIATIALLLPPLPFFIQIAFKIVCGMIIARAAFPWHGWRRYLCLCGVYAALNFGFAGVLIFLLLNGFLPGAEYNNLSVYLAISPPVLFWCAAGIYFLLRLCGIFLPPKAGESYCVKIWIGQHSISLRTLRDTGFSLREPISGKPVLLVSFPAIREKLPEEIRYFLEQWSQEGSPTPLAEYKFRLVPMGTASGRNILPALLLPITVTDHAQDILPVAFSDQKFGKGEYDALAAPELLD